MGGQADKIAEIENKVAEKRDMSHPLPGKIGIFLVDDSKPFLAVASSFLSMYNQVRIEGSSTSIIHAIGDICRIKPDLVILDLVMPDMNGLEATRWIKKHTISTRVIIVSLHDHQEYRASAQAVGADEFLTKTEFANQIMNVINRMFSEVID